MGSEILRCAQDNNAGLPERSEGCGFVGSEILRCAQDDRAVLPAALWPTQAHGRLHLTPIGPGYLSPRQGSRKGSYTCPPNRMLHFP
ncbi:MAG: hypothetical protein ACJ8DI_27570 [Ktedonobacteraceae bacterium]